MNNDFVFSGILQNLHEYGSITDTMSLLKPIYQTSMLIPYEQLFIQTFHRNGNLITEQGTGEQNSLFQLAIDTMLTSATTWKESRSTRHPQHTQISSNSSTIATDNNTVCTSFIILQNILHFPQNTHYQQQL